VGVEERRLDDICSTQQRGPRSHWLHSIFSAEFTIRKVTTTAFSLDAIDPKGRRLSYKNCFRAAPLGCAEDDKPLGALVRLVMQRWESDLPIQPISPVDEQEQSGKNA
jgi:hypothetical protein